VWPLIKPQAQGGPSLDFRLSLTHRHPYHVVLNPLRASLRDRGETVDEIENAAFGRRNSDRHGAWRGIGAGGHRARHTLRLNAGDGNSGLDSFGNSWEWVDSNEGVGIWCTYNFRMPPTYAVYGQGRPASGFEVQFFVPVNIPASIVTSELFDQTTGDNWTATVSDATHTVTFAAPAGQTLATGDKYYLKIAFGQLVDGSTIGFSAYFTAPGAGSAIPEISTWAMKGPGFAGLGFTGYRATRKTAAAPV
jgi:hypothetical protein